MEAGGEKMKNDFKSAVFRLCKKLSVSEEAKNIRDIIHDMSVVVTTENDDPKVWKRPPHGDLAQIAAHNRLQFLGYLLADDSVDDINKTPPFKATHLDEKERSIIENAYATLQLFIDECTNELIARNPKIALLVDPYSLHRRPQLQTPASSFVEAIEFKECADAFKRGKVYSRLFENEALRVLENVDDNIIRQLCAIQRRQFTEDFKATTKETEEYIQKITSRNEFNMPDLLLTYSTYCYALRQSLTIASQMLFEAILGHDMLVMNNDNIIDIADHKVDSVYEKYTVLIQDAIIGFSGGEVGSIVLLSCTPTDNNQIKCFGVVFALTVSLIGEFGQSSKITFVTVDEELNEIHHLTDTIMSTKIGTVPVRYRKK